MRISIMFSLYKALIMDFGFETAYVVTVATAYQGNRQERRSGASRIRMHLNLHLHPKDWMITKFISKHREHFVSAIMSIPMWVTIVIALMSCSSESVSPSKTTKLSEFTAFSVKYTGVAITTAVQDSIDVITVNAGSNSIVFYGVHERIANHYVLNVCDQFSLNNSFLYLTAHISGKTYQSIDGVLTRTSDGFTFDCEMSEDCPGTVRHTFTGKVYY